MSKFLTIFTPTYNRYNILPRLYKSLCNQTCKDFVWLVVDDGSSDNTKELFTYWYEDNIIKIYYYQQENQGKSAALNKGIKECKSELFTCVDSDDYLTEDAVSVIKEAWVSCKSNSVGILCLREVSFIPMKMKGDCFYTTLRDAYIKYGIKGDTMIIYKSNVIKRYKYPYFEGEKFVPEDYVNDQIDQEGKFLFLKKVLYKGAYLDSGYTKNMARLIKNNPMGYSSFISQRLGYDKTLKQKIADTIRHIAINQVLKKNGQKTKMVYWGLYLLLYPLGYYFYIKRYKNI